MRHVGGDDDRKGARLEWLEDTQHDAGRSWIEADLFQRLASSRRERILVSVLHSAAGEPHMTGPGVTRTERATTEQQLCALGAVTQADHDACGGGRSRC